MTDRKSRGGDRIDRFFADARKRIDARQASYREQALQMFPWICGRCAREFTRANLKELTVHHRDHNHDNNPADGSNWELLCIYCHENEHARHVDASQGIGSKTHSRSSTYKPFTGLGKILNKK